MRILLVDDDPNVRSALRLLLENEPGMTVVGDHAGAEGLLEQVRSTRADVVLVDWGLPDLVASGTLEQLRCSRPACQLLALSGRPEERQDALRAGAVGFVSKCDAPQSLLAALSDMRREK